MKTEITTHDGRPAFALESYSAPVPLPSCKRLTREHELQGHTIAALITDPGGRLGSGTTVIVTETRCWLVLQANGLDDDDLEIVVASGSGYSASENLYDYLSAGDLLHAGLIHQGEFDAFRAVEKAKELEQKAHRAAQLRSQLARLEAELK